LESGRTWRTFHESKSSKIWGTKKKILLLLSQEFQPEKSGGFSNKHGELLEKCWYVIQRNGDGSMTHKRSLLIETGYEDVAFPCLSSMIKTGWP